MPARLRQKLLERGRERFGPLGDFFREPAPRADRGTVRYLILDAVTNEPRHGYDILRAIDQKSGGVYRPSPGVVYPTLQMLEELGHLQLRAKDDRKVYGITTAGRTELAAHTDEVAEFYESSSDGGIGRFGEDLHDLGHRLRRLMHLLKRSFRRGQLAPAKVRRVRSVINQAIDQLEELLEEDP